MLKAKLSQTDWAKIVAAVQTQKATMTDLAHTYGVSIHTISHTFKKITGKTRRPQLSQRESNYCRSVINRDSFGEGSGTAIWCLSICHQLPL